jgi:hypothetical protein
MPLTFIGLPFLGFLSVLAVGYNHLSGAAVAYLDAAVIALTALLTVALVRHANRIGDARALRSVTNSLTWLSEHLGVAATLELVESAASLKLAAEATGFFDVSSLAHVISQWRSLSEQIDSNLLDDTMKNAARNGEFYVVGAIIDARHPRTPTGWTTDRDVLDVTEDVLRHLNASGHIDAKSFRAELRRSLYQPAGQG